MRDRSEEVAICEQYCQYQRDRDRDVEFQIRPKHQPPDAEFIIDGETKLAEVTLLGVGNKSPHSYIRREGGEVTDRPYKGQRYLGGRHGLNMCDEKERDGRFHELLKEAVDAKSSQSKKRIEQGNRHTPILLILDGSALSYDPDIDYIIQNKVLEDSLFDEVFILDNWINRPPYHWCRDIGNVQ